MQKRFLPVITATTILLLAAVIWIVFPPGTEASSDAAAGQPVFFPVAGAGTVIILRGEDQIEIMSVFPYKGYSYETQIARGSRVEVLFRSDERNVLFSAVLDGHEVKVKSTVLDDDGDTLANGTTSSNAEVMVGVNGPITQLRIPTTTAGSATTRTASTAPTVTTSPPRTTSTAAPTTTVVPTTAGATTTTAGRTTTTTVPPTTTTIPPTTTTTIAPTTTTIPPTTTTVGPSIPDGDQAYSLGEAGSVTLTFINERIAAAIFNLQPGWMIDDIGGSPTRFSVELRNGASRVEFSAEIKAGEVQVRLTEDYD